VPKLGGLTPPPSDQEVMATTQGSSSSSSNNNSSTTAFHTDLMLNGNGQQADQISGAGGPAHLDATYYSTIVCTVPICMIFMLWYLCITKVTKSGR